MCLCECFRLNLPCLAAQDNYNTVLSQSGIVTTNQISQCITWIKPAAVEGKTRFWVLLYVTWCLSLGGGRSRGTSKQDLINGSSHSITLTVFKHRCNTNIWLASHSLQITASFKNKEKLLEDKLKILEQMLTVTMCPRKNSSTASHLKERWNTHTNTHAQPHTQEYKSAALC